MSVEHEPQPLPAVQLLDRVHARTHSVAQLAHSDSADAHHVGEERRARGTRPGSDAYLLPFVLSLLIIL